LLQKDILCELKPPASNPQTQEVTSTYSIILSVVGVQGQFLEFSSNLLQLTTHILRNNCAHVKTDSSPATPVSV
jgi:hypothetical protein